LVVPLPQKNIKIIKNYFGEHKDIITKLLNSDTGTAIANASG